MSGLTVPIGYSFGRGAAPAQYDFGKPLLGHGWGADGGSSPLTTMSAPDPMAGVPTMASLPQLGANPAEPGMFGGLFDGFLGSSTTGANGVKIDKQGWGMPALGVAQGAFNAWMGMKQYGLAKQQLAEGKQQFGLNYDAQRTITNAQLRDRQAARVASNPGAYQSVGDYMAANGIRPR